MAPLVEDAAVSRRVLMIAYHFPPLAGSSGIQRTLRFVQQLPSFGWQPLVLTTAPMAYERTQADLLGEVPAGTVIQRAFALDTARHLAWRGRYIAAMARPDRWISWRFDAVRQGLQLIRRFRPQALWSTYPIATAHVIGAELQRLSGLPWIADFRDPMAQDGYPPDPLTWQAYRRIEECTVRQARLCTFTSPSAARIYASRYGADPERMALLENGYDEDSFIAAERAAQAALPLHAGRLTLLHSGIVYPSERDPRPLFAALEQLSRSGRINPGQLAIRFRAPVHDELLRELALAHGVQAFVEICPAVGYGEALEEMVRADALLVMQAANCNEQVPAKLYEYLRAGRPVLCLSDARGDTARTLRAAGVSAISQLDSADEIASLIARFAADHSSGRLRDAPSSYLPTSAAIASASRQRRTGELAGYLDDIAGKA